MSDERYPSELGVKDA